MCNLIFGKHILVLVWFYVKHVFQTHEKTKDVVFVIVQLSAAFSGLGCPPKRATRPPADLVNPPHHPVTGNTPDIDLVKQKFQILALIFLNPITCTTVKFYTNGTKKCIPNYIKWVNIIWCGSAEIYYIIISFNQD